MLLDVRDATDDQPPDDTAKFDPKAMMSGALPTQFSTVH
jgi:hypothetical protein